jgi:divalent metal cation (Fe/Co/Zn/Cd) transporter
MATATAPATQPFVHHHHRVVVIVAVAAALAFGAGAATVSLTSSDATTNHPTNPAATSATNTDAHALWTQLATLPANDRDNIVMGLSPNVRAQLRATGEAIATAAENR